MLAYLLIILAFLADRLSKRWALSFLERHGAVQVHPLLSIREVYNEGIAMGMFQGVGPIVGWLTILIVIAFFIALLRVPRDQHLLRAGLALVIGGALGNLVDRVTVGHVLDFLQTPLLPSVFNVADILVYAGLFLVLLDGFLARRTQEPPQQAAQDR